MRDSPVVVAVAVAVARTHPRAIPLAMITTRKSIRGLSGKLKLANSCSQTQVGVCERHKNSRQTRFYLTPTVCKRVCRLFLCRSHTPTWVCQHEFANVSFSCEGRFSFLYGYGAPLGGPSGRRSSAIT